MTSAVDVANDLYRRFNAGDLEGVLGLLDADVRWELVGPAELPYFGLRRGIDEVRDFFGLLGDYVQVEELRVDRVIPTQDGALAEGMERASFRTNGASYTMRWCHVMNVREGRIVAFTDHNDTAAILEAFRKG